MATQNEIIVHYVEDGASTIESVKVLADNIDILADRRDVIQIVDRRWDGSQWWVTKVDGWPCYSIGRYNKKGSSTESGSRLIRARPKVGPQNAQAREITMDDPNGNGFRQKTWPDDLEQAPTGGRDTFVGFDDNHANYTMLLGLANAVDLNALPITTAVTESLQSTESGTTSSVTVSTAAAMGAGATQNIVDPDTIPE